MLALHTKASSLDSFMKETLKLKALIPNPDEPEPKKKKNITKTRKDENTKASMFFYFVLPIFRVLRPSGLRTAQ